VTEEQKQMIQAMREAGQTMPHIAAALGVSVNTVKSFCQRTRNSKDYCRNCGALLAQVPVGRNKIFCTDKCRYAWWDKNRDKMQRRAVYPVTCAGCGVKFESYGNKHRKYCSHPCYVRSRWPQ
jgi:hypothetical protein